MPEKRPLDEFLERRQKKIDEEKKKSDNEIERLKQKKERAKKQLCDHIVKTAEYGLITEEMIDREKGEMTSDEIYRMHQNKIKEIDSKTKDHRQRLNGLDDRERELLTDNISHATITTLTSDALPYKIKVDDLESLLKLNDENEMNVPKGKLDKAGLGHLEPIMKNLIEEYPQLFDKDGRLKEEVKNRLNLIKW